VSRESEVAANETRLADATSIERRSNRELNVTAPG
jgi:hypothetical protein